MTRAELLYHALSATAALDIARQLRTLMPANNGGKLRAAMSRKSDTSQVWLDRAYPHHVTLPADKVKKLQKRILVASAALNTAPTRVTHRDGQMFVVYRFANKIDAQGFIDSFGGEPLVPNSMMDP